MGSRAQVIVVASSSGSQGAVRDSKHAGADALTARHVQPAVHPHTAASCCGPVRDLLLRFGLRSPHSVDARLLALGCEREDHKQDNIC